jgi:hypothetical protein
MDQENFQELNMRPESYDPACASTARRGPSKATVLTRCHAMFFLQIMEYLPSKPAFSIISVEG